MTMTLAEKKMRVALAGAVLKTADAPAGSVWAVVNTGYRDRQSDTMAVNCWRKVVSERQEPLAFWAHGLGALPLGNASNLQELSPGDRRIPQLEQGKSNEPVGALLARLNFADTTSGRDALTLAKGGYCKEWSVQFDVAPDGEEPDGRGGRVVKLVNRLYEISMVPAGASLGTYTLGTAAKSAFERLQSTRATDVYGPIMDAAKDMIEDRLRRELRARERETMGDWGAIRNYIDRTHALTPDDEDYQRFYDEAEIARAAGLSPHPAHIVAEQKMAQLAQLRSRIKELVR